MFLANNIKKVTSFEKKKTSYKILLYLHVRRPSVREFLIFYPGRGIIGKLCGCLGRTASALLGSRGKKSGRQCGALRNKLGLFIATVQL